MKRGWREKEVDGVMKVMGGRRLRRQISLDYYTIPPATQANKYVGFEAPMNINY